MDSTASAPVPLSGPHRASRFCPWRDGDEEYRIRPRQTSNHGSPPRHVSWRVELLLERDRICHVRRRHEARSIGTSAVRHEAAERREKHITHAQIVCRLVSSALCAAVGISNAEASVRIPARARPRPIKRSSSAICHPRHLDIARYGLAISCSIAQGLIDEVMSMHSRRGGVYIKKNPECLSTLGAVRWRRALVF